MVRQWVKIPIKVSQTGLWKKGNARNGRGVANSLFASALANLKKAFVRGKVNKAVEGLCETQFKLQLHNH